MSTIVLACTSLKEYIEATTETQNVNYDIVLINRNFHIEPAQMKKELQNTLSKFSTNIDTVLLWDSVVAHRIV